jgi:PRTRC genetic system protein B
MPKAPKDLNVATLTPSPPDMALDKAILIYTPGASSKSTAIATLHDTTPTGQLLAGVTLSPENAATIFRSLCAQKNESAFIPEHILCRSETTVAWWRKAGYATLFFDIRDTHGKRAKDNPLNKLSGTRVPQPPLVFIARSGGGLTVFALREDRRPLPATTLYHSPYRNVSDCGSVCLGSMKPSREPAEVEEGFFKTSFTHSNRGIIAKEMPAWTAARTARRFPTGMLTETGLTLGKLLSQH